MQLKQATIYGFGKWVDQTVDFTTEPFLCIYGENESGKSTLQQFILFMLFGLSPKKRAFYRPKQSGKLGGRLTIINSQGMEFAIERLDETNNGAAVCYTPDGLSHDEAWLQEQLGGMTYATYQSIFSFSALDLADMKTMKEEELSEVLLGIGLTGSKRIQAIEKRLDAKLAELFKPFGKKPEINVQLDELDRLSDVLHKHGQAEATYREKKAALQSLTNSIGSLQEKLKQTRQALLVNEKTQQALPVIKAYNRDKNLLAGYPDTILFPENGLERLEMLRKELLPLESELSVIADNQEKYQEKQESIRKQLYPNDIYERAKQIIRDKDNCIETQNELARVSESIKEVEMKLDNEIAQLDIGLTREQLENLILPFHTEKTWQELKDTRQQLNLEEEHVRQERGQITRNRDYLLDERKRLTAARLAEADVRELSRRIDEFTQREYEERARKDAIGQLEKWQKENAKKEKRASTWLYGGIVAAVIVAVIALLLNQPLIYGLSALLLAVGFMQSAAGKKSSQDLNYLLRDEGQSPINVTVEERQEAEQLLEEHRKIERELTGINEQLRTNDVNLLQLEEKENVLQQKNMRLEEQISHQCDQYPFLHHVDLAYWPELLHTLKRLLSLESDRKQLNDKCNVLTDKLRNYREELVDFYQQLQWDPAEKSVVELFVPVEQLISGYQDQLKSIAHYNELLESNEDSRRTLSKKMEVYAKEIGGLLAYAETDTEEDFMKRGKQRAEKQEIKERISQHNNQLATILPDGNPERIMEKAVVSESELELEHEEYSETIDRLEMELEEKRQKRADITADLSAMESSESYSETLHRFSVEEERLHKFAEQWSIYKSAREMLAETKRKYRNKYLGAVIERTAGYFEVLTGGMYPRIFAPESDQPFLVESSEGIRYAAQELSQGTIDQLYVALRLGISDVMSEKHRLPFIIDDAFVHFDAVRTSRIVKMLADTACTQQVILFTCKQEVAECAGDRNVLTLMNSVRINQP